MNRPKQLIILGGGYSINEGIDKGLWSKIEHKFVIGTNFSFHTFPNSTCLCCVDKDFYDGTMKGHYKGDRIVANLNEKGKQHVKNLKKLPLIVTVKRKDIMPVYSNTIVLPNTNTYKRDVSKGCYKSSLAGIFALSLGIHLLDEGEIFLLGMDFGGHITSNITNKKREIFTHYYQGKINHRGIGKVAHYNTRGRAKRDYEVYNKEEKCKIYNVSLISKIPESIFPKISYEEFFRRLDKGTFNQDKLRKEIRRKLNG